MGPLSAKTTSQPAGSLDCRTVMAELAGLQAPIAVQQKFCAKKRGTA